MHHLPPLRPRGVGRAPQAPAHRRLRQFVGQNAAGLRMAADLLGGTRNAAAVDEIIDRLRHEPVPSRRTLRLLDELLLLLSLELVTDLDSPEAAAFSAISPEDPAVADICLLTDGLRAVLASLPPVPSKARPVVYPGGREAA